MEAKKCIMNHPLFTKIMDVIEKKLANDIAWYYKNRSADENTLFKHEKRMLCLFNEIPIKDDESLRNVIQFNGIVRRPCGIKYTVIVKDTVIVKMLFYAKPEDGQIKFAHKVL